MIKQLTSFIFVIAVLFSCGRDDGNGDYTDRMNEEHEGEQPAANASADVEPSQSVVSQVVVYGDQEGTELTGYMARPEEERENLPGLIVIHEWWGLNDNIETMTRRLAGEGYVALAVDMYGGEVAESSDEARELMQAAMDDQDLGSDNIRQAYRYLTEEAGIEQVGVIGWCFGGAWSLNTALDMPDDIDATVIYYGRLESDPDELAQLDMPILGIFGAEDEGIPVEEVNAFEQTLDSLDKDAEIHIYEGADHAFANPSGDRYNAEAASDAWEKTVSFLNEFLKE